MASIHQYLDTNSLRGLNERTEAGIQIVLNPTELEFLQDVLPTYSGLSYAAVTLSYDAVCEPYYGSLTERNLEAVQDSFDPRAIALPFNKAVYLGRFSIEPFALVSSIMVRIPEQKRKSNASFSLITSLHKPKFEEGEPSHALRVPRFGLRSFVPMGLIDLVEINWMLRDGIHMTEPRDSNLPIAFVRIAEEVLRSELLDRYGNRTPYNIHSTGAEFTLALLEELIKRLPHISSTKLNSDRLQTLTVPAMPI